MVPSAILAESFGDTFVAAATGACFVDLRLLLPRRFHTQLFYGFQSSMNL